jgi:nitroreductase
MSAPTSPEHLLARLRWRYSTKQFDKARPIAPELWAALEDALVLSPSSFGLQPWKFVVVDDPALRQQLCAASWNQAQITDASKLVVFLGQRSMAANDVERYVARFSEVRGTPPGSLEGLKRTLVGFITNSQISKDLAGWNAHQVYIALGQFMVAAAMLGIDTCALEGIDTAAYDRLLGCEGSPFTTLCVCTAGHRLATDRNATAAKVRYAKDQVIERR